MRRMSGSMRYSPAVQVYPALSLLECFDAVASLYQSSVLAMLICRVSPLPASQGAALQVELAGRRVLHPSGEMLLAKKSWVEGRSAGEMGQLFQPSAAARWCPASRCVAGLVVGNGLLAAVRRSLEPSNQPKHTPAVCNVHRSLAVHEAPGQPWGPGATGAEVAETSPRYLLV